MNEHLQLTMAVERYSRIGDLLGAKPIFLANDIVYKGVSCHRGRKNKGHAGGEVTFASCWRRGVLKPNTRDRVIFKC